VTKRRSLAEREVEREGARAGCWAPASLQGDIPRNENQAAAALQ